MSDERLVCYFIKKSQFHHKKRINSQIRTWSKAMNKHHTETNTQMTNTDIKRHSATLAMGQMLTTQWYHNIPVKMAKMK